MLMILLVVLIVVLLGGVGPAVHPGVPWAYGYGGGNVVNLLVGLLLIFLVGRLMGWW